MPHASAPPAAGGLSPEVKRLAIVVVLGAIMSVLDMTVVNVALDTLARDLHSPLDDIQWVVTAYMLSLAAVIPVTGWVSNRFGSKRVYLASLVLFTAGSVLCAVATSTASLVIFRVLQGVGGGLLMPVGQIMLVRAAGARNMGRVMAVIGVPMMLAPVLGPTVGGLLLEHLGWEWIFLINVPIGAAAIVAAVRLLPANAPEPVERLDWVSLALLSVGLPALIYGLAEVGTHGGVGHAQVMVPGLIGLALVATFVVHALRTENPLLDLRLFANRAYSAAALTTFALGAGMFGAMLVMPLYFQTVRAQGAVDTGLLLAPQGLGAAIAMVVSGRIADRVGGGIVAVVGIALTTVTTIPFVLIGADTSFWLLGAAMLARGLGIGSAMMPSMSAAFAVLSRDQVHHATPQLSVIQRVGGSAGTALFTVVLSQHLVGAHSPAAAADAFGVTYWWTLGVTAVAVIPAIVLAVVERRARRAHVAAPPAVAEERAIEAAV
jgi:EmrB/QacA subfamily drug resistance transporter